MRTLTATEASRRFSELLDAIAAGETVVITRGSHPIAEIRPAPRRLGRDLRLALDETPPLDADVERDIAAALDTVRMEVPDPWGGD